MTVLPQARQAAPRPAVRFLRQALGPGLITGGADNDPGGITTYSVVGATAGFTQNWLLLLSTPMLIAVQLMAAKVGSVTKTDLATAIRNAYGRRVAGPAVALAVIANLITIGADLLMMGAVLQLLTRVPLVDFMVPLTALMAGLTIFVDYRRLSRYMSWLVGIFAAYVLAALLARPDWPDVLRQTVVPHLTPSPAYLVAAVGLLGTTITPYLFFFQTSGEVEERRGVQAMGASRVDIATGMVWSNIAAFFILVATGTVLHPHHAGIATAADAARALEPFAGRFAALLFSVGILGSGMLAIPVLAASTAYSVGGLFGWPRGLSHRVGSASAFYVVLGLSFLIGVQLAVMGADPVRSLFYSQVLDGLVAPVLVLLLLLLTSSRRRMGDFVNGRTTIGVVVLTMLVLVGADIAMIASTVRSGLPV